MHGSLELDFGRAIFEEVNLDGGLLDVVMFRGIVDELVDLLQTHPGGLLAENKEQRFNEVRFARAIGTNDAGELVMKWANFQSAVVALEIF